jgi:hypothetical protein
MDLITATSSSKETDDVTREMARQNRDEVYHTVYSFGGPFAR